MAQQAVVTDFFTRKRNRGLTQPSKRQKIRGGIIEETTAENKEVKATTTRVTRSTLKQSSKISETFSAVQDYFSPQSRQTSSNTNAKKKNDKNVVKEPTVSVTTQAKDNHNVPISPSKRQLDSKDDETNCKRGRITPKKKYDFEESNKEEPEMDFVKKASQKVKKTAKKRLVLNDKTEKEAELKKTEASVSEKLIKSKKVEKNRDQSNENVTNQTPEEVEKKITDITSPALTRSRKAKKDTSLEKATNIAEKLLAKKKQSPDTVKDALKSQGNLKDLQATLLKMRDLKRKEKEEAKKAKLKEQKGKRKEPKSTKSTALKKKEYAFSRLHSLAQEIPKGLSLPYKYKLVQDIFRSCDTVVSMLFNRQETATWAKVQTSVKDMLRKNFEKRELSQIKHVFPDAYNYRQEKGIRSYDNHLKTSAYQLTIEPNLHNEVVGEEMKERKLTSGLLIQRRHHFHVAMLAIVKKHHQEYLATLDPPVIVEDEKLRRWHPSFPLDQVEDLGESDLPPPPDEEKNRCNSAKDVLDKAKDRLTKKAVEALKKVADRCSMTPEKSNKLSSSETNNNSVNATPKSDNSASKVKTNSALNGISKSLLAKIREKEKEQKLREMVRSEEDDRKIEQLRQLPEVARTLRMLFVTDKKASLPLEYVCGKLSKCCPSVCTPALMEMHIKLLAEKLPVWVKVLAVRKQDYLKLDKNMQLSEVVNKLNIILKEAEKS